MQANSDRRLIVEEDDSARQQEIDPPSDEPNPQLVCVSHRLEQPLVRRRAT
jgi:hypothetical protein